MIALERRWRVMNTDAHAIAYAERGSTARVVRALEEAEVTTRRVEETFSRFRPESELSRLNARAGRWVDVSAWMAEVLELAYGLHDRTRGLFDPSILADLERAGYERSFEALPSWREAAPGGPAHRSAGFADVEMGAARVRLPADLRIDLGGIVKGWAADTVVDALSAVGPCLVSLGGDVAARGAPPGAEGWDVDVILPDGGALGVARVRDGAVATSGTDARRWRVGDGWAHHLIDPRTHDPARTDLAQVTAFAPTAAAAEVWAKAVLIAGAERGGDLAPDADVELVLVPRVGPPVATTGAPLVYGPPAAA